MYTFLFSKYCEPIPVCFDKLPVNYSEQKPFPLNVDLFLTLPININDGVFRVLDGVTETGTYIREPCLPQYSTTTPQSGLSAFVY